MLQSRKHVFMRAQIWNFHLACQRKGPRPHCSPAPKCRAIKVISQRTSLFGFGLFDGHGLGSQVADLAASSLLPFVARQRDILRVNPRHRKKLTRTRSQALREDHQRQDSSPLLSQRWRVEAEEMLGLSFTQCQDEAQILYGNERLGSTATVALVQKDSLYATKWNISVAWVGDSRCMVQEPGDAPARALTTDHHLTLRREHARCSTIAAREAENFEAGQRRTHLWHGRLMNESTGVHTEVTRAIGDGLASPALHADSLDVVHTVVADGSTLVICSDGVWGVLNETQVGDIVRQFRDPHKASFVISSTAQQVRELEGRAQDDISAVVVHLDACLRQPLRGTSF